MSDSLPLDRPTPVSQSIFQEAYGSLLICCQVMLVLYGLSVLQSYLYFIRHNEDHIFLRGLVPVLFCLSTMHTILVCHTVWHYLVSSYTDVNLLIEGAWSGYAAVPIGVLICFLAQCFYARMIFTLSKGILKYAIGIVMVVLTLAQLGFGIELSVKLFQIWEQFLLAKVVYIALVPLFCVRMLSDTVTACTLCFMLRNTPAADFRGSVKLVQTLILYAVNRFILTTAVVAVETIYMVIRPDAIWPMALDFVTVHVYVNSLLATLNARDHLREIGSNTNQSLSGPILDGSSALTSMTFRSEPHNRMRRDPTQINLGLGRSSADPECFELEDMNMAAKVPTNPLEGSFV